MTARHSRPNSHNTAGGTERPAGASRPTVQALRLLDVYQESWSATRMYWKAPQYPMAARHSRPNSHNTAGGTARPAGAARPTVQALRLLDVYQESWSATRMYWEAPQDPIAKEPYTSAGAGAAVGVVMEASATSVRSHVTVPAGMAT